MNVLSIKSGVVYAYAIGNNMVYRVSNTLFDLQLSVPSLRICKPRSVARVTYKDTLIRHQLQCHALGVSEEKEVFCSPFRHVVVDSFFHHPKNLLFRRIQNYACHVS